VVGTLRRSCVSGVLPVQMSQSIIIPPVRINVRIQARTRRVSGEREREKNMHNDVLDRTDKLPRAFGKYATYNTIVTWSALHQAVMNIERLGAARHGSEPEVLRSATTYVCRMSSFGRPMRPANLLKVVDSIATSATDIDVLLRSQGEGCVLEIVIPTEVFEHPRGLPMKDPTRSRRVDAEAEDRFRAMDTYLASLQPMRDVGAISPSLKRSVMNVLGALNREMASCMLNASLLIKGQTETNVELSVTFDPKPVDVRILQRTITQFGQCIRDMTIDVDRGACVIDFPVGNSERRAKKPKEIARTRQLVDGATRINAHTVTFDSTRGQRKQGWSRVHRKPPAGYRRPGHLQRKRRVYAMQQRDDEDMLERNQKRRRRQ